MVTNQTIAVIFLKKQNSFCTFHQTKPSYTMAVSFSSFNPSDSFLSAIK